MKSHHFVQNCIDLIEQPSSENLTLFLINISILYYLRDFLLSFSFFHLKVSQELACIRTKIPHRLGSTHPFLFAFIFCLKKKKET